MSYLVSFLLWMLDSSRFIIITRLTKSGKLQQINLDIDPSVPGVKEIAFSRDDVAIKSRLLRNFIL